LLLALLAGRAIARGQLALELIHAQAQELDLGTKLLDLIERRSTQLGDRVAQAIARGGRRISRLLSRLANAATGACGAAFRPTQDVVRKLLRALSRQCGGTERGLDRSRDGTPDGVGNSSATCFRSRRHVKRLGA
jgi:hypothetical protein